MCTEIYVKPAIVSTIGELATLVGGRDKIAWYDIEDDESSGFGTDTSSPDEACLCGCDVEMTMAKAGYSVRQGWDDVGCDWIAENDPTRLPRPSEQEGR